MVIPFLIILSLLFVNYFYSKNDIKFYNTLLKNESFQEHHKIKCLFHLGVNTRLTYYNVYANSEKILLIKYFTPKKPIESLFSNSYIIILNNENIQANNTVFLDNYKNKNDRIIINGTLYRKNVFNHSKTINPSKIKISIFLFSKIF